MHLTSCARNTNSIEGLPSLGIAGAGFGFGTLRYFFSHKKHTDSSTLEITDVPKFQHDTSSSNIRGACKEFSQIIGSESGSTAAQDLLIHLGSDFQSYAWTPETATPGAAVVYPGSTEYVSKIVKVCHRRKIPITPYSGGTSIEGQYPVGGVAIDFSCMDRVIEINLLDLNCMVQSGVGWQDLNHELASDGLFFLLDLGPGAQIDGMIGTGCSGTNAVAYGTMKDWVLSLTVVLSESPTDKVWTTYVAVPMSRLADIIEDMYIEL